jgi:PadR family transcriptional regulator, regulatory protein PadR
MDGPPRITMNLLRVLRVLLEDPTAEHYGLEVGKAAGLSGGSLYPLMMRLEKARLVVSCWEDTDPSEAGRPRRRLYRLNTEGAEFARQALQDAQQSLATTREQTPAWGRTPGFPVPGGAPA